MSKYSVSLKKIINDHSFEPLYLPKDADEIMITSPDVNRPGLIFSGYEDFFDPTRMQFLGRSEVEFLNQISEPVRRCRIDRYMQKQPVAIVVTRGLECPKDIIELAPKYGVPVLSSTDTTSRCMASIIAYLNIELAERITRHGVLVEVYGEGVLILGDSGVGKSEAAIELIKRGHRLIADDAVEIRKTSAKTLIGSAPDNIRHFIEVRGVGVINARRIFGMGAVKISEKIDMIVKLENWDSEKNYDRMGLESEYSEVLGIKIPISTVPVKPGRNIAIIIEVAAMNNRQKKMGYNGARELLENLGMAEDIPEEKNEVQVWHNFN